MSAGNVAEPGWCVNVKIYDTEIEKGCVLLTVVRIAQRCLISVWQKKPLEL